MIIDFHTHYSAANGDIGKLIAGMDQQGVDVSGISAVASLSGDYGKQGNKDIYEVVKKYPDRLIGYASVIPYASDAPDLITFYVENYGFRALKLHPSIQQFFPSDQRIYPAIERAIKLDIPILIHTGAVPIPKTHSRFDDPMEVDDLALAFPEAKIIIAHGDPFGTAPAIAGKHPNVYMDTTTTFARYVSLFPGLGESTLKFMGLVTTENTTLFGSRKTIFGSDANPIKTYRIEENLAPLKNLNIPDEEKALILGGNAAKLLKVNA